MNKLLWFAPFAALVVFGAWLGWNLGVPRSDTEIITRYAADYVRETGRGTNECEARPSDDEAVRMIIDCLGPQGGGYRYIVGPRGALKSRIKIPVPDA